MTVGRVPGGMDHDADVDDATLDERDVDDADVDGDGHWYRLLFTQLRVVSKRAEAAERRTRLLENAVSGMAREMGCCRPGPPCTDCGDSLLLVDRGRMRCPQCGFQRSL